MIRHGWYPDTKAEQILKLSRWHASRPCPELANARLFLQRPDTKPLTAKKWIQFHTRFVAETCIVCGKRAVYAGGVAHDTGRVEGYCSTHRHVAGPRERLRRQKADERQGQREAYWDHQDREAKRVDGRRHRRKSGTAVIRVTTTRNFR